MLDTIYMIKEQTINANVPLIFNYFFNGKDGLVGSEESTDIWLEVREFKL